MRKLLIVLGFAGFFFSTASCANGESSTATDNTDKVAEATDKGGVVYLNEATFKKEVFDYSTQKQWKYQGEVPAILDFYADWCGPCKMIAPILETMQKEYDGKIQVYKVNTDKQKALAATFGIQSLPTIVFIPMEGEPQAVMGFRPQADLEKMVSDVLKVQK